MATIRIKNHICPAASIQHKETLPSMKAGGFEWVTTLGSSINPRPAGGQWFRLVGGVPVSLSGWGGPSVTQWGGVSNYSRFPLWEGLVRVVTSLLREI